MEILFSHNFISKLFELTAILIGASLLAQVVKHLSAVQETQVQPLSEEDPLEKETATHSSTLVWKFPWTEKPGRLHRVHWVSKSQTRLSDFTFSFAFFTFLSKFLSR